MAYAADTVWLYQPGAAGASNNNGGGFAASDGGARITTAVAYTDLVIDAADNTKATSVARPFAATDPGNTLNITAGTGWTVQRARIVSVAGGVATFDRALGTVGSTGGTGNLGGALDTWTDALLELCVAGNTIEPWATGTMTPGAALAVSADGTATAPITVDGRASDGSADPTGDNRPLIAAGAYDLFGSSPDYWIIRNLRITCANIYGLRIGTWGRYENCAVNNSSETASRRAIVVGQYGVAIGCEAQSANGYGITAGTGPVLIVRCYVHDSGGTAYPGIDLPTSGAVLECTIDTCYGGIQAAANATRVLHTAIYNCTIGIADDGTARTGLVLENCIIASCTTGVSLTALYPHNYADWCNYYACTTDRTNLAAGTHDIDADPQWTNAAGGNFARDAVTVADGAGATLGVG